jgi:hypothetical protein
MRDSYLAILRDAKSETKESEVAVGDIVPVGGAQFKETLAGEGDIALACRVRTQLSPCSA